MYRVFNTLVELFKDFRVLYTYETDASSAENRPLVKDPPSAQISLNVNPKV